MAVKVFQPSEYKEQAKQLLRGGKTPEEVAVAIPLSTRTIYRYLKEVQNEKLGIPPPGKRQPPAPSVTPGVSKEAFTATGTPALAPPGSPTPEYITLGTFRFPLEDWGYSSALNLLIVSATFDQSRKEYKFPKTMKVGDFIAELCQAFRIMKGWDVIGGGYLPNNITEEEGNHDHATTGTATAAG